jgi:phage gp46-like protein
MSDIGLTWNVYAADVTIAANDLAVDDGLETAVILSLFTDRRAEASDPLPDGHTDPRGWWGDAFPPVDGDRIGSRLWLLGREKEQPAVLMRAREYAVEALQWLIADKVAARVDVTTEFTRPGLLGLQVVIHKPLADPVEYRFSATWAAQEARRAA